jgi:isocitrate dehydrogenase (NAD+)
MPNMYGDLVAELCAGLIGGTGLAPGAHFGDDLAVFEATHGTAPQLAGTNRANPMGVILSAAMMLRHIGEREAGDRVEAAVAELLAEGRHVTYDVRAPGDDRPAAGTFQVADEVVALVVR